MSLASVKCNICGTILPNPYRIIGESEQVYMRKQIQAITIHMQEQATKEHAKPRQPHAEAMAQAMGAGQNMIGLVIGSYFDLTPDLAQQHDAERSKFQAMTRKVTISDEDLDRMHSILTMAISPAEQGRIYLEDMRDRYEERGKYAPVQPEAATK